MNTVQTPNDQQYRFNGRRNHCGRVMGVDGSNEAQQPLVEQLACGRTGRKRKGRGFQRVVERREAKEDD